MGCACQRQKIEINPIGFFSRSYCSGKDIENPIDKNRESIINGQTYYQTLLSKKCGKKKTLNEYDIIENKLSYDEEEDKKNNFNRHSSSSYNIIELIPMEKRSLLTKIEKPKNEKLVKTYIMNKTKKSPKAKKIQSKSVSPIQVNSSLNKLRNFFDDEQSLITEKNPIEKNSFNLFPNYNERMIEIWFDKGDEIKFIINNDKWGIKQKGLCDYKGYKEKYNNFNLCCLLMRIGDENNYNPVVSNITYYSQNKGPLFLKMNISEKYLRDNNYNLEGMIRIELLNGEKISPYQIFNRYGFEGDFFDYQKNDVLFTVNVFRKHPKKFYSIYLYGEKIDDCDFDKFKSLKSLIFCEKLQRICEYIIKNQKNDNFDDLIVFHDIDLNDIVLNVTNKFNIPQYILNDCHFKLAKFKMDYNVPLDFIKKIIRDNQYKNLIMSKYNYIGICFDKYNKEKNLVKCYILLSDYFL